MLSGIHILLTLKCTARCDHCFVFGSPEGEATLSGRELEKLFSQLMQIKSLKWIYFEGGEPFLFYPLLLLGTKTATRAGYRVGIVTNAYWATDLEDARLWLKPLQRYNVQDLSISCGDFHSHSRAERALKAAEELKIAASLLPTKKPSIKNGKLDNGGLMFRGRAAEELTTGLPASRGEIFSSCPHEQLNNPERVHLDPHGNLHLCQGLTIGNIWQQTISELLSSYLQKEHPLLSPLIAGGPAQLAKEMGLITEEEFVDACHYCYWIRQQLRKKKQLQKFLLPAEFYGA